MIGLSFLLDWKLKNTSSFVDSWFAGTHFSPGFVGRVSANTYAHYRSVRKAA